MAKLISIKNLTKEDKILLIKGLGYGSDGIFVINEKSEKHLDKYIKEPVKINNMFIYPGSTIILDNNPLSISCFLEEYGDNAIQ